MTNIKITQEAREAASALMLQIYGDRLYGDRTKRGEVTQGLHDSNYIVQSMQALINQTVERCAVVAEQRRRYFVADSMADVRCFAKFSAKEAATAIRTLKDN